MLATAEIIDVKKMPATERVIFGSTVTLCNLQTDQEVCYRVVSDYEADVKKGLISYASPLGRAVIGREVGEEVKLTTPGGQREYEIVDVDYE